MKIIKFKKLVPEAKIPAYANSGSSGMDVSSVAALTIEPGEWVAVSTGLMADIPEDMEIQVRPRSGLALKHGITVLNTPGTVDSSYLGEIKVILINHGKNAFSVNAGDRIAQFVVADIPRVCVEEVQDITKITARGTGGFGSTGK